MCGILFLHQAARNDATVAQFKVALARQSWRGPDHQGMAVEGEGTFLLGHNRLSIVDPNQRSHQPMRSRCKRFMMLYNGEIYNHRQLREKHRLLCSTASDTETVLEGYAQKGEAIFAMLILDTVSGQWVAARDAMGVKPLYFHTGASRCVVGSEPAVIADLVGATVSDMSVAEWRGIRRPLPGFSFFEGVHELLPGHLMRSDGTKTRFWSRTASDAEVEQAEFEHLLSESVLAHEMSDCTNVALLSGGLDSGVITAISSVQTVYSVGLHDHHEFVGATETARTLDRKIHCVGVTAAELESTWRQLAQRRGEPLSVPNEGLIYLACKRMQPDEKVVLTGEGADELLFGYDKIFRWAMSAEWPGVEAFLLRYGYAAAGRAGASALPRLHAYIEAMRAGKTLIAFVEDFFLDVHLSGLLRRMDFASMAASKEARVPFVNTALMRYLYRRQAPIRLDALESKIPLRLFARQLGLHAVLDRAKIGFSASVESNADRFLEYENFQRVNLDALGWRE